MDTLIVIKCAHATTIILVNFFKYFNEPLWQPGIFCDEIEEFKIETTYASDREARRKSRIFLNADTRFRNIVCHSYANKSQES